MHALYEPVLNLTLPHQSFQKASFLLSTLHHLSGSFIFLHSGKCFQKAPKMHFQVYPDPGTTMDGLEI